MVSGLADFFQPPAQDRGIKMELDIRDEAAVKGGHAYLQQVLLNLLDNAVKYTSSRGQPVFMKGQTMRVKWSTPRIRKLTSPGRSWV
jgi:signal transduction histidine kinase